MKVILLKGVQKLGNKLDIVNVADGFAMNSLFPQKLAEPATPAAIARAEKLRALEDEQRKVKEENILKNLKSISEVTINLSGKASEKGHLFAGVHKDEIVSALKEQAGLDIDPLYIDLAKPIKEVGAHQVTVKVQGKSAEFTANIQAA